LPRFFDRIDLHLPEDFGGPNDPRFSTRTTISIWIVLVFGPTKHVPLTSRTVNMAQPNIHGVMYAVQLPGREPFGTNSSGDSEPIFQPRQTQNDRSSRDGQILKLEADVPTSLPFTYGLTRTAARMSRLVQSVCPWADSPRSVYAHAILSGVAPVTQPIISRQSPVNVVRNRGWPGLRNRSRPLTPPFPSVTNLPPVTGNSGDLSHLNGQVVVPTGATQPILPLTYGTGTMVAPNPGAWSNKRPESVFPPPKGWSLRTSMLDWPPHHLSTSKKKKKKIRAEAL